MHLRSSPLFRVLEEGQKLRLLAFLTGLVSKNAEMKRRWNPGFNAFFWDFTHLRGPKSHRRWVKSNFPSPLPDRSLNWIVNNLEWKKMYRKQKDISSVSFQDASNRSFFFSLNFCKNVHRDMWWMLPPIKTEIGRPFKNYRYAWYRKLLICQCVTFYRMGHHRCHNSNSNVRDPQQKTHASISDQRTRNHSQPFNRRSSSFGSFIDRRRMLSNQWDTTRRWSTFAVLGFDIRYPLFRHTCLSRMSVLRSFSSYYLHKQQTYHPRHHCYCLPWCWCKVFEIVSYNYFNCSTAIESHMKALEEITKNVAALLEMAGDAFPG
jgi:hypothetical protein